MVIIKVTLEDDVEIISHGTDVDTLQDIGLENTDIQSAITEGWARFDNELNEYVLEED